MKTVAFLIVTLFLTSLHTVRAQDYPPLINNSCWHIEVNMFGLAHTTWIIPQKDTVIGNKTYKKFADSLRKWDYSLIREDVARKKVYTYRGSGPEDVLYDFSLNLHDTTIILNRRFYVSAVDSVLIEPGKKRRMLIIESVDPMLGGEIWIEGVGNFMHPLKSALELPSDPSYMLKCSYQRGNVVFNRSKMGAGCAAPCCPEPPKIADPARAWFPNPFNTSSSFHTDKHLDGVTMIVYSSSGQKVKEVRGLSGSTITLHRNTLPAGLYFIVLVHEGRILNREKLLVLDN